MFSFVIVQFLFGIPIFSLSIRMSMSGQTNDPILYLNMEYPSLSIKFLWLTTMPQHQEAAVHNPCQWLFHHKHSWPYHFYKMLLSVFLEVSTLIILSAFFQIYFSSSHPTSKIDYLCHFLCCQQKQQSQNTHSPCLFSHLLPNITIPRLEVLRWKETELLAVFWKHSPLISL